MRPSVSSGEREGYATAVTGLWRSLSRALVDLEAIAAEPDELTDEAIGELASLQYSLHAAAELAAGIQPPDGVEPVHTELAAALAAARDGTGEVVEALETGGTLAAEPLVPEWRGALFRVRLARMRIAAPKPPPAVTPLEEPPSFPVTALAATLLAITGTALFAAGTTTASWPTWTAGLLLFCGAILVFQPRP
ncbi:MAG: hypothetical protein M3R70_14140 [Actinomycetota bacterium]|nr:hypothetical protein [Actinomycetota bacterium]